MRNTPRGSGPLGAKQTGYVGFLIACLVGAGIVAVLAFVSIYVMNMVAVVGALGAAMILLVIAIPLFLIITYAAYMLFRGRTII